MVGAGRLSSPSGQYRSLLRPALVIYSDEGVACQKLLLDIRVGQLLRGAILKAGISYLNTVPSSGFRLPNPFLPPQRGCRVATRANHHLFAFEGESPT